MPNTHVPIQLQIPPLHPTQLPRLQFQIAVPAKVVLDLKGHVLDALAVFEEHAPVASFEARSVALFDRSLALELAAADGVDEELLVAHG